MGMQGDRPKQLGYDDEIRIGIISNIDDKVIRIRALGLVEDYFKHGAWSGKSIDGIIAGAEYASRLLCNDKLTQDVIAEKYGVNKVTIRKRYMEIIESEPSKGIHPTEMATWTSFT